MAKRRFGPRFLLIFVLFLVAVVATCPWWAPALGWFLVRDDGAAKADMAVCLAGDFYGFRLLKTAELVKNGFVPKVLISSPVGPYDVPEGDLALRFAIQRGFPPEWFIVSPNDSLSTRAEAVALLADLNRRHVRTFLLVTSDFHTARAGRLYRSVLRESGYSMTFRVVAAPHKYFNPSRWWASRESRKYFFNEWVKTLTSPFGI